MKQILTFVLLVPLIVWFVLSTIYKDVIVTRQIMLQQEADYLLEVGARRGFISADMVEESKQRLSDQSGFEKDKLIYTIQTDPISGPSATDPNSPLPRGYGIYLEISYPYLDLWSIDKMIGIITPSSNDRMKGKGFQMSEYMP